MKPLDQINKEHHQIIKEHQAKLQAIRDRKGSTAELIDQVKANSAEIVAELKALRKERINPDSDVMTARWLTNMNSLMEKASTIRLASSSNEGGSCAFFTESI